MKEEPNIALKGDNDVKELADCFSILRDLKFVIDALTMLKELLKENKKEGVLTEALWTSALITYCRCFTSGKRFGLEEKIYKNIKGEPIKAHRNFKSMRDKHIAHSVNPFDQTQVGIILEENSKKEKRVIGIANLSIKYITPEIEGVNGLVILATKARQKVQKRFKKLEKTVIEKTKNIPIEKLSSGKKMEIRVPGPEDANRPRK